MTYTDTQLQLALAKMLPEQLSIYRDIGDRPMFFWETVDIYRAVEDTEWLHVCWLVEEELSDKEIDLYLFILDNIMNRDIETKAHKRINTFRYHASWQQRAVALAQVKGIEIC